jgi:hypothetical protein
VSSRFLPSGEERAFSGWHGRYDTQEETYESGTITVSGGTGLGLPISLLDISRADVRSARGRYKASNRFVASIAGPNTHGGLPGASGPSGSLDTFFRGYDFSRDAKSVFSTTADTIASSIASMAWVLELEGVLPPDLLARLRKVHHDPAKRDDRYARPDAHPARLVTYLCQEAVSAGRDPDDFFAEGWVPPALLFEVIAAATYEARHKISEAVVARRRVVFESAKRADAAQLAQRLDDPAHDYAMIPFTGAETTMVQKWLEALTRDDLAAAQIASQRAITRGLAALHTGKSSSGKTTGKPGGGGGTARPDGGSGDGPTGSPSAARGGGTPGGGRGGGGKGPKGSTPSGGKGKGKGRGLGQGASGQHSPTAPSETSWAPTGSGKGPNAADAAPGGGDDGSASPSH